MRLIWSKLASWRLFFLGKDLVLHFKQFQLLDPHFSTIFNIQKCNIFVVFFNSPDASEKVDLMLFLWSARLVKIYSLTSFIKTYNFWHFSMFHTLQEQPSKLHNLQHFLNCTFLFIQYMMFNLSSSNFQERQSGIAKW